MIAWGIRRKYKGAEKWLVFPHFSRKNAREFARTYQENEHSSLVKWSVHKISMNTLQNYGCGIVDDVGVTCKRHSPKERSKDAGNDTLG